MPMTRRSLLGSFLSAPVLHLFAGMPVLAQSAPKLELTPACSDDAEPTISSTEGPFFTPDAPLKHDLAEDVQGGERITIAGYVLDQDCRPIPNALLQIWHANQDGVYDNSGFRLRGHQYADETGRWWFTTIVPARYSFRTRHYHFKAQKPNGPVLTTQLYFPDEPDNERDSLFDPRLLMEVSDAEDGRFGRFDFVL